MRATLALNGLNALHVKSPSAQNILDAYTFEKKLDSHFSRSCLLMLALVRMFRYILGFSSLIKVVLVSLFAIFQELNIFTPSTLPTLSLPKLQWLDIFI